MTERERLLEAVVEAARETVREIGGTDGLFEALRELRHFDAHQPQPAAGETVEVRAYVRPSNDGGAYIVSGMGALDGRWIEPAPGSAYAILTARVPLPTVPTIVAEVRT